MSASRALCPRFHRAIELIGRRWTGAIIFVLLEGPARFSELRASIPDVGDRMLAERLRELEHEEILVRTVVGATPVRVEYSLTDKGRALAETVTVIGEWGHKWLAEDSAPSPCPGVEAHRSDAA